MLHALDVFQKAGIRSLPVSPLQILRDMGVPVLTYGQYSEASGKSLPYLLERFGPDGMTFPIDGKLTVFYNDLAAEGRIRWTLCHELSHILLHYGKEDAFGSRAPLPGGKDPLEAQADALAKELLGPLVVLHFCAVDSVTELRRLTGFSHQAAGYRFQELCAFRARPSALASREDLRLFLQFEPFITGYIAKKTSVREVDIDVTV
ncbi:ImmA/IrrE family metallo-endopeptidase [Zongyangia hominis]|uniref:ImmA/IrrE family metallo-endopeptidase n=1 Tax=Zongyangia hominis TaxID=2763677 RepID=A0A926IBA3_9FIRM|nr:ImmA/IrrE family metallo-endopeptidase [Zongyangia hominis]MBC8569910.1 ImmA/IrrE family metallo-endopeptidase [Zongyangia hominis]